MLKISKAALFAAALSLTAMPGLSLAPAMAEETASPSTPELGFKLDIPTVVAVGSSMDESAIRDALSGNFLNHVDELAKLTATSITIPEVTFTTTASMEGTTERSTAVYKNLVLSNIKDGVAETVTMDSAESNSTGGKFAYGKMTYNNWNLAGSMALAGLVPGASSDFSQIIGSYKIDGATFSGSGADCTLGAWSGAESDARPVTVLLKDVIAAGQELQAAPKAAPPPAAMKTVVTYITDILTSFRTSPTTIGGLDCKVTADGDTIAFGFGGITVGGFAPGIYPSVTLTNFKLDAGAKGTLSIDKVELKQIDLNPPIAAVKADIDNLSPAWFEKNGRKLVPSMAGFDFSGLKVDFADPEAPDSRIQASIADFDLSLSNYVNGIPTKAASHTTGLDIPLPDKSTDQNIVMLKSMGLSRVSLNYDIAAGWDQASQTLSIDKVAVSGNDLGSIAIAAVIGNATDQLFDVDPNVQQAASLGVTIKSINLDLGDAGIADMAVPMMASSQGADPTTFRQQMAATAEGAAIAMLGSSDGARAVGKALSDFIIGAQKNLSVTVTSKDPNGLPVPLLIQAQDDPSVLQNAVDVAATAK